LPRASTAPAAELWPQSDQCEGALHPRETKDLIGHPEAEKAFLSAYQSGRLPYAFLLEGVEGIGKATLAWRLIKFILAHPDPSSPFVQDASNLSIEPDLPSTKRVLSLSHGNLLLLRRNWNEATKKHYTEIRVDDIRKAIHFFHHAPSEDGWRIALIDSVDDLNASSGNALLKLIEEPPQRCL
jgi:DNA polymerase-3 subunit delta'